MSNKTLENIVICILVGIVLCLLLPVVQKIVYKSQLEGAESSANGAIASVQVLFTKANLNEEIPLPFKVKYTKNGYQTYARDKKIKLHTTITNDGEDPIDGEISISLTGDIVVKNLKFSHFTCNKETLKPLECKRNS